MLLLAALRVGGEPSAGPESVPSRFAAETLLTAVARAGERLVAVGAWGHVVLSDDGGRSWRQAASVPTRRTLTSVHFANAREGWVVGHDALVLHSADGGETWEVQHRNPEADAPLLSVWFEDAQHGIAVGGFGLLLETRDGGRSWQERRVGAEGEEPHLNHLFAAPDGTLLIAAEFGAAFRSRDRGASWQALRLPYEGSLWWGLALDEPPALLMFGMRGHVFRSEDMGDTWEPVETDTDRSLQGAAHFSDGRVVAVGHGGVVLTSADGGHSFRSSVQPDRSGLAAVAEGAGGAVLLFGEKGVASPVDRG